MKPKEQEQEQTNDNDKQIVLKPNQSSDLDLPGDIQGLPSSQNTNNIMQMYKQNPVRLFMGAKTSQIVLLTSICQNKK